MMISKRIKAFLLFGVILLSLVCAGCDNHPEQSTATGKFMTLSEAYEKHYIDRADLLNIAYHYNGEENINDSDFIPRRISLTELGEATIQAIKEAHLNRIINDAPQATIEGIKIARYFGTYNNCVVLVMRDDYLIVDPLVNNEYVLDGVKFLNFVDGYPIGIEIYIEE